MSYRALYRVWRPQTFQDLVGQEHITRTLQNALAEDSFSHAYLFSGPRGTGKTSAAKIMAKAVNCEKGPAPEPCNDCQTCRRITEGSLMDVVEIDAASNRGVDEIRDLRDKVKYAPTEVRYKVYIIDEVHMLTTEAFNALLKTLEEPPGHVIFILATTEPHKLPPTIISRCQRFAFRRIALPEIVSRLQYICEAQSVETDENALHQIALAADGGMRDALSLLDQVLAFGGRRVDEETVLAVTGSVSRTELAGILSALAHADAGAALERADRLIMGGLEPERLLQDLIHACRDLLLMKTAPQLPEVKDRLHHPLWTELAEKWSVDRLSAVMDGLIAYQQQMKWTPHPRIVLELAIVNASQSRPAAGEKEEVPPDTVRRLEERIRQLEERLQSIQGQIATQGSPQSAGFRRHDPPQKAPARSAGASVEQDRWKRLLPQSDAETFRHVKQWWPDILQKVKERKITVHAWLVDGDPVMASKDAVVVAFKNKIHRETTEKETNKSLIEQVMQEVLGSSFRLITVMRQDWDALSDSMAEMSAAAEEGRNEDAPRSDEVIKKAVELFGEDLVEVVD
ncbi:DNA polymerase III subunit gamma/tau [Polycladomyces sp. WAk]|uniref:DNA-directed DNA polymerase n=1 Tax=Polycladomyces zharkentensis TaxID=2807616 RepID=A0ABS2WFM0_9BACL|nr:DNA polymerase III subunit gamma/tau [Polycladomyces sp. WAk]MBN2908210.1 DNA polymerase III subunit gamma/tau [Polycladomyces sp. WAk]